MVVSKHVRFVGRVQGVGFRYAAQGLAASFPITGYVRNLPTGDVELVVEGEADQVDAFLSALNRQMAGYVNECQINDGSVVGHGNFGIRY